MNIYNVNRKVSGALSPTSLREEPAVECNQGVPPSWSGWRRG